jgi:hypothetical protein
VLDRVEPCHFTSRMSGRMQAQVHKTVFISYRRLSVELLAVQYTAWRAAHIPDLDLSSPSCFSETRAWASRYFYRTFHHLHVR